RRSEPALLHRLHEIIHSAGLHTLNRDFQIAGRGHDDHGNIWVIDGDLLENCMTGNVWLRQIQDDYAHIPLGEERQDLAAIIDGEDIRKSGCAQGDTSAMKDSRLVIDQEHWKRRKAFHCDQPSRSSFTNSSACSWHGSSILARVPLP